MCVELIIVSVIVCMESYCVMTVLKVLLLTNIPAPYMVDYLNELGKYCDVTAIFEREASNARDNSWKIWNGKNFKSIVLRGIKMGGRDADTAICPQVIKYISRVYDRIIVCNPCTPTGIIAVTYMKLMKISYGFQSEGGFPGNGYSIKELLKRYIFTGGDFYFSTAPLGDEYFIKYGAKISKIKRYPFTSLYEKDILHAPVTIEAKERLRRELGIKCDKMVISVGRFLPYKGHDVLIKACDKLGDDVGIYIIGGKPTKEYLELKSKLDLNNLFFVDFLDKEMIRKYYMAADVFALNARDDTWGLVVNEAMANGLPVVTTKKCFAALAMIDEGLGGYIVDVDDKQQLHARIAELLQNKELCYKMGEHNIDKSGYFTLENMGRIVSFSL